MHRIEDKVLIRVGIVFGNAFYDQPSKGMSPYFAIQTCLWHRGRFWPNDLVLKLAEAGEGILSDLRFYAATFEIVR